MNDSGYGQLSKPNQSLKLVLVHGENHQELFVPYSHYLGQGFLCILFFKLIFSNTEDRISYLDQTIIFEDFISYPINANFRDFITKDFKVIIKIQSSIHKMSLKSQVKGPHTQLLSEST